MGKSFSSNQPRLELLPNELFIEIFEYMDSDDLRNFKGLNKRIDLIIEGLKINVNTHRMETVNTIFLSAFDSSQIIRLEMRNRWSSMNLTSMMELRSLTLDCGCLTREQVDQ
ncbi:unnamed protein product, partial [Adineta steineri]